ncbi:hypothetical protein ACUUL3_03725 [Thiovibrio sp. JS02]
MRQHLCGFADRLLSPFKIKAVTEKKFSETLRLRDNLISLYNARCAWEKKNDPNAACLVFSKDRAMQLHAFLASLYGKITPTITTHVLFHTSNAAHQQSYEELARLCNGFPIRFHRQQSGGSFREDLISLLTDCPEGKVVFFVDDIIVTEKIDLHDLLGFDTDRFVPSLRLGLNLTGNYTTGRPQPLPPLRERVIADTDKITWQWQDGLLDWGYPLSVDGHLFSRQEMVAMLTLIPFSAPNSLEDRLQCFRPLFAERHGVAYRKSKIMNLPCNRVQTENRNLAGNIHQDHLLEKWNAGYVIDLEKFAGFNNTSAHQELDVQFIKRAPALLPGLKG